MGVCDPHPHPPKFAKKLENSRKKVDNNSGEKLLR